MIGSPKGGRFPLRQGQFFNHIVLEKVTKLTFGYFGQKNQVENADTENIGLR